MTRFQIYALGLGLVWGAFSARAAGHERKVSSTKHFSLAEAAKQVHAKSAGRIVVVGGDGSIVQADGVEAIVVDAEGLEFAFIAVANAVCNADKSFTMNGKGFLCVAR